MRVSLFFLILLLFKTPGSAQEKIEEIKIQTLPGLQYDRVQIALKPGVQVRITFTNNDDMSHNLLIVKPGKRLAVVEASNDLAEKGPEAGYVPKSDDILWVIPVIAPGQSATVSFTAPATPGAYPFVCTYPGHGYVMYGVIHISNDLKMPALNADPDVPDVRKAPDLAAHEGHQIVPRLHPYDLEPPYFYRAFMERSGLASFAVRLPGELAFCWDADACKLQYAWEGGFVDNTDFWHGHKNAYAKILGHIFYQDRESHPLRIGNRGLPPSVKFKGYRIVDKYPEFWYLVNGVEVFELIREAPKGAGLERRFRIPYGLEPVWFLRGENDGMDYQLGSGRSIEGSEVKLTPQEAKDFTIIMKRAK